MASQAHSSSTRWCFVTVGATAAFTSLLLAVLDQDFLQTLRQSGYTNLLVQYGRDGSAIFESFSNKYPPGDPGRHGLEIEGFDFNHSGLTREMRLAQANSSDGTSGGLVISHGGSGSILQALRLGIPLVVVPNSSLKDNHQVELAEELEKQGYVVVGNLKDLANAIHKAEALRARIQTWPPAQDSSQRRRQTLEEVMSDELGFLD